MISRVWIVLAAALIACPPGAFAQTTIVPQEFEVASVKVSTVDGYSNFSSWGTERFTATRISLRNLVSLAFGTGDDRVFGGPGWIESERYDVVAKAEAGIQLTPETVKPMMQRLLTQRFRLVAHLESREAQGYALVVDKGGPTLRPAATDAASRVGFWDGGLQSPNLSIATFAGVLRRIMDTPVVDETGIPGSFEIRLAYSPQSAPDPALPSLFTAVQEQLGLRLEKRRITYEVVVIDHVEHPMSD